MSEKIKQKVEGDGNLQVGGDLTINVDKSETKVTERFLRASYLLLTVSIVGASLPHQGINTITSLAAVFLFLMVFTFSWDLRRAGSSVSFKNHKTIILAVFTFSMITGCAGPMLAHVPDPAIQDLAQNYKAGVDHGVGVLGFGLDKINIQSAAQKGGIEEVYFADQIRGYGLISYRKVSVFGE